MNEKTKINRTDLENGNIKEGADTDSAMEEEADCHRDSAISGGILD